MKKILLTGVAGVTLLAIAPAHAADLGRPVYKAPPPVVAPVPLFSWTGCSHRVGMGTRYDIDSQPCVFGAGPARAGSWTFHPIRLG